MAKNDLTADANESGEPQDDTRSDDARNEDTPNEDAPNEDAPNEDAPNDDAPNKDDVAPWTGADRRAPTRAAAELCAREQLLALIQAMCSEQGRARLIGIYDVRVVHSALFDLGFLSDPRDAVAAGPHPIYDNAACRIPEFAAALEAIDPTTCHERADLVALIARAPDAHSRNYLQSILDFRMPPAADSPRPLE